MAACEALKNIFEKENTNIIEFVYCLSNKDYTKYPDKNIATEKFFTSIIYQERWCSDYNKVYQTSLVKDAFSKMLDFYLIVGEDFFESTAIAYYTKSYIQTNEVLYYYMYNKKQSASFIKENVEIIERQVQSIFDTVKYFNRKKIIKLLSKYLKDKLISTHFEKMKISIFIVFLKRLLPRIICFIKSNMAASVE